MPGHYPPNWREIAEAVKTSAGWRCENCGHPNAVYSDLKTRQLVAVDLPCDDGCLHERNTTKPRILTVHHLDEDKANCEPWNLVALCQVCHMRIQFIWLYRPGQLVLPGWQLPEWITRREAERLAIEVTR